MGLVYRTLGLGALRITTNLACSKVPAFTQSIGGQTIVLLLFTDVCVTGYIFICWFADLQLPKVQEMISLRFAAFLNETYNAVSFLIPALIAAEAYFTARCQRMLTTACRAPANYPLPQVNGVYVLLCWTVAASYGARYYPEGVSFARQCSEDNPADHLRCLCSFHLPDPLLASVALLIAASYIFYQGKCTGSPEAQRRVSRTTQVAFSGLPLSEDPPLMGSHLQATVSPHTPATQPDYLFIGLVAAVMLSAGFPLLGLTSPLIFCFEQLCCRFFARLSKYSQHDVEATQSAPHGLIHTLQTSERKGLKLLENADRPDQTFIL